MSKPANPVLSSLKSDLEAELLQDFPFTDALKKCRFLHDFQFAEPRDGGLRDCICPCGHKGTATERQIHCQQPDCFYSTWRSLLEVYCHENEVRDLMLAQKQLRERLSALPQEVPAAAPEPEIKPQTPPRDPDPAPAPKTRKKASQTVQDRDLAQVLAEPPVRLPGSVLPVTKWKPGTPAKTAKQMLERSQVQQAVWIDCENQIYRLTEREVVRERFLCRNPSCLEANHLGTDSLTVSLFHLPLTRDRKQMARFMTYHCPACGYRSVTQDGHPLPAFESTHLEACDIPLTAFPQAVSRADRKTDITRNLLTPSILATTEMEPERVLVSPWLTDQTLALIVGPDGMGKSQLMWALARAMIQGGEIAGLWRSPGGLRVLVFDFETPVKQLQQRLGQWFGHGNRIGSSLQVWNKFDQIKKMGTRANIDLTQEADRTLVTEIIDDLRPDAVFFDSTTMAGVSALDRDQYGPLMQWAAEQRAREDSPRALVFLHHTNRGGTFKGDREFRAPVDVEVLLSPAGLSRMGGKPSKLIRLNYGKARNFDPSQQDGTVLKLVEDDNRTFDFIQDTDTKASQREQQEVRLLSLISLHPGCNAVYLRDRMGLDQTESTKKKVSRQVEKLIGLGLVTVTGSGNKRKLSLSEGGQERLLDLDDQGRLLGLLTDDEYPPVRRSLECQIPLPDPGP